MNEVTFRVVPGHAEEPREYGKRAGDYAARSGGPSPGLLSPLPVAWREGSTCFKTSQEEGVSQPAQPAAGSDERGHRTTGGGGRGEGPPLHVHSFR